MRTDDRGHPSELILGCNLLQLLKHAEPARRAALASVRGKWSHNATSTQASLTCDKSMASSAARTSDCRTSSVYEETTPRNGTGPFTSAMTIRIVKTWPTTPTLAAIPRTDEEVGTHDQCH